jgi:hypothetical protein
VAASTTIPKGVFVAGLVAYAAIDTLALVYTIRQGWWLAAVAATLLGGTVPYAVIAAVMEHRSLLLLVANFKEQSYAFLFGDALFLPLTAAMAALGWQHTPRLASTWATSRWWEGASVAMGLLISYLYRYVKDLPIYRKAGAMGAFFAPTKLVHDLLSYPVLTIGLLCGGIPLFVESVNAQWPVVHLYAAPYLWPGLLGVGLWAGVGAAHDLGWFSPMPNPHNLHPNNWAWPAKKHRRP